jgi:hypothetical protein
VHRTTAFDRRDVRTLDNIPLTSPARTLLDVAASAPDELDAAFDEAVFRKVRLPQLRDVLSRSSGRPGVQALRELVEAEAGGSATAAKPRSASRASSLPQDSPSRSPTRESAASSSTSCGPSTASSPSSTGSPPTASGRPSRAIARATGTSKPWTIESCG